MNIINRTKEAITNPFYFKSYLKESLAKALFFIFLMHLIFAIPGIILNTISTNAIFTQMSDAFKSHFSGIELKDYTLNTIDGDTLFFDLNSGGVHTAFVIDTQDAYSIADLSNYDTGYIFDKEYFVHYTPGLDPIKTYYKDFKMFFPDMTITGAEIADSLNVMTPVTTIAMILFSVISAFIFVLFTGLLVSIAASLNNSMMKLRMPYKNSLKISLYSILLPVMFYPLLTLLPIVPDILLLLIFYFISGRYISKTYRIIYTDSLNQAIKKHKMNQQEGKADSESKDETNKED